MTGRPACACESPRDGRGNCVRARSCCGGERAAPRRIRISTRSAVQHNAAILRLNSSAPQPQIDLRQLVGQAVDVVEHQVMAGSKDLRKILVRHGIHRDAEGMHALGHRLLHRHARVFVQITPVAAVVVILGAAIGQQQQQTPPALDAVEGRRRVADRRAHARRHAADLRTDVVGHPCSSKPFSV
jgi:hypothetical protein